MQKSIQNCVLCTSRGSFYGQNKWAHSNGDPEPSLIEPFNDYSDAESCLETRTISGKENFAPPPATAPPLEADDLQDFIRMRTQALDELIQVEGIPKMYILVDYSKWGSRDHREMLQKRNDLMLKRTELLQKHKVKKVSFCEVNEVFPASPIIHYHDIHIATRYEGSAAGTGLNSPTMQHELSQRAIAYHASDRKQAFGLRKKPALYTLGGGELAFNVFSL
jgi:hypothetical protein